MRSIGMLFASALAVGSALLLGFRFAGSSAADDAANVAASSPKPIC